MAHIEERQTANGVKFIVRINLRNFPRRAESFDSREEAEAWGIKTEAELRARRFSNAADDEQYVVSTIVEEYCAARSLDCAASLDAIRIMAFSTKPVTELTVRDVLNWSDTPNDATRLLEDAIEATRKYSDIVIPTNPVKDAYGRALEINRVSPDTEAALLSAAKSSRGGYLADAIVLAIETTLQASEIAQLHAYSVSVDTKEIKVESKSGVRTIPLSDRAAAVLAPRLTNPDGLVFEKLSYSALQRAFDRTCTRAGISGVTLTDLRNEAICRFIERGMTLSQVWRAVGDKSQESLQAYFDLVSDKTK